jgi:hypothetical protein
MTLQFLACPGAFAFAFSFALSFAFAFGLGFGRVVGHGDNCPNTGFA